MFRGGIRRICFAIAKVATVVLRSTPVESLALSAVEGVDDILGYDKLVAVEKTLGAKFNIRAFHDTVLELGSVPLPVVTARIDRFIAEGGKGPYPDME